MKKRVKVKEVAKVKVKVVEEKDQVK